LFECYLVDVVTLAFAVLEGLLLDGAVDLEVWQNLEDLG